VGKELSPAEFDLIILDRDGVINYDTFQSVRKVSEFKFIEGSVEAVSKLKTLFPLAIATNQKGIARGEFSRETLNEIHAYMTAELAKHDAAIDVIQVAVDDASPPRLKPYPDMLNTCLAHFKVAPERALFIGDKFSDYQAAVAAGCAFVLLKTSYGQETSEMPEFQETGAPVYDTLAHFVEQFLG